MQRDWANFICQQFCSSFSGNAIWSSFVFCFVGAFFEARFQRYVGVVIADFLDRI